MRWQKALACALKDMILSIMGGLLGAVIALYLYNGNFLFEVVILIVIFTIMLFFLYYQAKKDTFM